MNSGSPGHYRLAPQRARVQRVEDHGPGRHRQDVVAEAALDDRAAGVRAQPRPLADFRPQDLQAPGHVPDSLLGDHEKLRVEQVEPQGGGGAAPRTRPRPGNTPPPRRSPSRAAASRRPNEGSRTIPSRAPRTPN